VVGRCLPHEQAKSGPPAESAVAAEPEAPLDAATDAEPTTDAGAPAEALSAGEPAEALSAGEPAEGPAPEEPPPLSPDPGAVAWPPGAGHATASPPEWTAPPAVPASDQTDGAVTAAPVRDTAGTESAVRAYCAELLNTPHWGLIADEILATTDLASTPADELLQATARLAAEHASVVLVQPGWRARRSAKHVDCHSTPGRLASRAGGNLGGVEEEQLEKHLRSCLHCQAAELRAARAERAFATALASGGLGVRESSGPPNVGVGDGSGPPSVGVGET
jgi:hypothetical protein